MESSSLAATQATTSQIAAALGVSGQAIRKRAAKEHWAPADARIQGGGHIYLIATLPLSAGEKQKVSAYLQGEEAAPASPEEALPILPAGNLPAPAEPAAELSPEALLPTLKTWQTRVMDARMAFIRAIERLEPSAGVSRAIKCLVEDSRDGALPADLQRLVPIANARGGKDGSPALAERTLFQWWSEFKKVGHFTALAPKTVEKQSLPAWVPYFMKLYQVPQKPSVSACLEDLRTMAPKGIKLPSEGQARRFLKKYSRLDIQRGRMTASQLKSRRLYTARDTEGFFPTDICLCDGHSFKALVAHPVHGRPFKPEVCAVIDAVTRVVMGWSAGLAESSHTVGDAVRHACLVTPDKPMGGLMLALFTDPGSGNKAGVNTDELSGLFPRLGIEFNPSATGNPQENGRIERLQASLWIRAAKKLDTYCGKDMDSAAARRVYLTLQKEVREAAKEQRDIQSSLLLSWPQFLDFCQEQVDAYNHRPHSRLPKITDPVTGRRRHMTPAERWEQFVADGWAPTLLEDWEIEGLFRPHETCDVRRGIVRLFGNVYSDPALEHYNGCRLPVGYDIHDPGRVWVRDEEGRLIVVAQLDAHKSKFMSVSRAEQLREERYKRRSGVVERKQEEIELERRGGALEVRPVPLKIDLAPETAARAQKIAETHQKRLEDQRRFRLVENTMEAHAALQQELAEGRPLTEKERQWLSEVEAFWRGEGKAGLFKSGWQPFAERNRRLMEAQKQKGEEKTDGEE